MTELIIRVDGMMCSMCEAHVKDAVRRSVPVQRITASHRKGEVRAVIEENTDRETLLNAIKATGYRVLGCEARPYKKRRLFSLFG